MELLKLLSTSQLVAQTVAFLIFFFLLRAIMWDKLLKFLDARKSGIEADYRSMETTRKSIDSLKLDYESRIKNIEEEKKAMLREAALENQKTYEQMKKAARQEAEEIVVRARETTRFEVTKAKNELKDELVNMVIDATEHLLEERLSEDEDKRIVNEFIENLEKK